MSARVRVAVADTGSGNLRSVEKALERAGANVVVTQDPDVVASADKVVVPGQGAFGACVAGLDRGGGAMRQAVLAMVRAGKPYLGICIGMQLLFEGSEENPGCSGLGLFPGKVARFPSDLNRRGFKIPHMGWNAAERGPAAACGVLDGTPDGTFFYFVHSYFPVPADPALVALSSEHGISFCSAVARENVFGCQFHPEKSQGAGLELLRRFVAL